MSSRELERAEYFIKFIDELKIENRDNDLLILVEGKNDILALRLLGFEGPIKPIKGKRLPDLIDEILLEYSRVLILSDWDVEGERLYKKIKFLLESYGIKVEDRYRKEIKSFAKKDVKDVEGLYVYVSGLKSKTRANI